MLAAWILAAAPGLQATEALQLSGEGRFLEAAQALEAETDPLERQRAATRLHYLGRDFEGALEAAEEGLALDPQNLEMLWHASAAAVWLGKLETTERHTEALAAAIEASTLEPEERVPWHQTVESRRADAERMRSRNEARDRALGRAKRTVIGAVALVAMLALIFYWRLGRAA